MERSCLLLPSPGERGSAISEGWLPWLRAATVVSGEGDGVGRPHCSQSFHCSSAATVWGHRDRACMGCTPALAGDMRWGGGPTPAGVPRILTSTSHGRLVVTPGCASI